MAAISNRQSRAAAKKRRISRGPTGSWRYRQAVRSIRRTERTLESLSDAELTKQSVAFVDESRSATSSTNVRDYIPLVAEAIYRTVGFRLHDVQLRAIVAACEGTIVEMQTGEGKTIVSGAIAACKGVEHPSVHVGTTNAYLAARDKAEVTPVFGMLGMTIGLLPEGSDPRQARAAYSQNVTYAPGYQYGFDYLRDQVELRKNRQNALGRQVVARIAGRNGNQTLLQPADHHIALIDEADSVMIDEAITPLVISGAARRSEDPTPFRIARRLALGLVEDDDYKFILPQRRIEISDDALEKCHEAIRNRRRLTLARPWTAYINNALRAEFVFQRDVDYVVSDDEVQIVDQNTGRIFSDRTWQNGLHQAVEAKEGVTVRSADATVARVTRQRYLCLYDELCGLTGTAASVASEFASVYGTRVVVIPPNRKCIRRHLPTRFFRDQDAKIDAITTDVASRAASGQPILIGTRTIAESRIVDAALQSKGIRAVVLNGVQDESEASIVSGAGEFGAITIATNMAGRGTDIKPDERALAAGGLHVVGCSPNASHRIDRQLMGRAARQGKPGSSQFFVAADDDIVSDYSTSLSRNIARASKRTGETRRNFAKELSRLQFEIENSQRKSRENMVRNDRRMDRVRSAIEREQA